VFKTFKKSFPAGKYLLGVNVVLTRWTKNVITQYGTPNGNVLRVDLCWKEEQKLDIRASLKLRCLYGSGAAYLPYIKETKTQHFQKNGFERTKTFVTFSDPVVNTTAPWNCIRLTATNVVSGGMGDLPDYSLPYLCVDELKITNVPGYKWIPRSRNRFNLLTAADLKPDTNGTNTVKKKSSSPVIVNKVSGNLIADGSFEAGGRPWWSPGMVGTEDFTFDSKDRLKGDAVHGDFYARLIPVESMAYADQHKGPYKYRASIHSSRSTIWTAS